MDEEIIMKFLVLQLLQLHLVKVLKLIWIVNLSVKLQKQRLNPLESFYQSTLGNAKALSLESKIGNLDIGTDADIIILDSCSNPTMKTRMKTVKNLIEELFVLQTMGDDRAVKQVYIMGIPNKN